MLMDCNCSSLAGSSGVFIRSLTILENGATQSCAMNSNKKKKKTLNYAWFGMCQDVYSSSRRRNTQPDVSIYQCVSVCNTNTQNALWLLILLWAMRTTLYTLFVEMHANDAKSVKSKLAADSVPKRERKTLLIRRWSMFWWRLWFCARHKNRIKETFFFSLDWDSFQIFLGVVLLEHKPEYKWSYGSLMPQGVIRTSNQQSA